MKRTWYDLWLDEGDELAVGCILLVLSGWWWFDSRGPIWDGWRNVLATLTVVLGPLFVNRAWKRKSGEVEERKLLEDELRYYRHYGGSDGEDEPFE
jgi:hypothetical protein